MNFNNNLNRNFLQFDFEQKFPRERPIITRIYYPSVDARFSFLQVIKTNLYLGLVNFGTVKSKEELLYQYFVDDNKYLSEKTYNNISQLCNLIPGATLIQMVLSINLLKTNSLIISLISLLFFIFPGLFIVTLLSFFFNYFTDNKEINNKSPYFEQFIVFLQAGFGQASVALCFTYCFEEIKQVFQSNFQMGLIIINTVILFITNHFPTLITLLLVSGYLTVKNRECEFLLEKASFEIISLITHDSSCSFLGLPCLILLITILVLLLIFGYYVFEQFILYFKLYLFGTVLFVDYASLNLLFTEFQTIFSSEQILSSFGLTSVFQGHIFNIVGSLFINQNINIWLVLINLFITYLPSILFLCFFIQLFSVLNENPNSQFWLKGMKTASIGFIIVLLPKFWYFSYYNNKYYHWTIGTILVLISSFCFYKKKFLIGFICSLGLAVIFSFICY